MNYTIDYYNKNADSFVSTTANVDFTANQDKFLSLLPTPPATIMDLGCGSGRDTLYFLKKGFAVEATDGSAELCKRAEELTGIKVRHMYFQELSELERFDGIWACSSILHLDYGSLKDVMVKIIKALKPGGIFYTSFKYGDYEGERNGRFFIDMDEERMAALLAEVRSEMENMEMHISAQPGVIGDVAEEKEGGRGAIFQLAEQWITADVRPGREADKWLNVLIRKNGQ